MSAAGRPNPVAGFFDRQAEDYFRGSMGMRPFADMIARHIEAEVDGRVAAVGGVWATADEERCRQIDLTIVDISPRMLEHWSASGYETLVADARDTPFPDASLDHVVFPGILHHITEGGFLSARAQVDAVLREAHRILRPGGRVWISDFSVHSAVYAAEGLLAPLTKRVLALAEIPLVIMHPEWVYDRSLRAAGFDDVDTLRPRPAAVSKLVRPVIGLSWLIVPRVLYPVTPVLISASRAGGNDSER